MIIVKSWLEEWIDLSGISADKLCETLNSIGLEVDAHTKFQMPKGVVVGFVKSRRAHENSDHLSVCEVDVGSEILQIVCGAKNVAEGQFVAVALVGAILPGEFKIKPAKLRGVESFGMICSSTELGLPKINEGIMVLDESIGELNLGEELSNIELFNDDVIEVELTPNRGDCLSLHGIARDLRAAFGRELKSVKYDASGEISDIKKHFNAKFSPEACSILFKMADISDFKLNLKLKMRAALAEISAKTEIQTLLNYATHATGVILYGYDVYKTENSAANSAQKFFSVCDGRGRTSIYDFDIHFLADCGIYQDEVGKIGENAQKIVLQASYSDPVKISTTVGEHKELKRDETLYRSTRGSEPDLALGMDYLCANLEAKIYKNEIKHEAEFAPKIVEFTALEISKMAGCEISKDKICEILRNLGFEISGDETLKAKVPAYRHDIENSHDICEEIVRIIGIDNIPAVPLVFSEKNRFNSAIGDYINRKNLRNKAVGAGFFECVHYIFDNQSELLNLGFKPCKKEIVNPINNELNMLKPTLLNHLINSASKNIKNSRKSIKLFEIGAVFDESGAQSQNLAFLMSGNIEEASLKAGPKPKEVDFIYFAGKVCDAIGEFKCQIPEKKIGFLNEFEQAEIIQNGRKIGFIGRLDLMLEKERDLFKTYVCEIEFEKLEFKTVIAKNYSKFPSISRDLSLLVPSDLRFERVRECIEALKIPNLTDFDVVDIYKDAALGEMSSVTVKLNFQDMEKTLEDKDIAEFVDKILAALKENLGIGLR